MISAAVGLPAAAWATVWTSQSAFDTAFAGLPAANFNYLASGIADAYGFDYLGENPFTSGGVTFSTPDGGGDLYLTNSSSFGGGYSTALSTGSFGDTLTVSFSAVSEVGFVVAQTYPDGGAAPVAFYAYDGATEIYEGVLTVNDLSSPNFIGFSGLGPITSVVMDTSPYGDPEFPTIVSVDGVAGVPEPGAWTLMLVGFGALGAVARSRRAAAMRVR